jgi:hypothetical protein
MPLTVSNATGWKLHSFVMVPFHLIVCDELTPNSRLILMFLINQIGYKSVSMSTIDRLLGIHRSTRIRCMAELKEFGFISGTECHIILNDPQPILAKLRVDREKSLNQVSMIIARDDYVELLASKQAEKEKTRLNAPKRDYMQEATDAWNKYRPKDYQRIRRISAPVMKALDIHLGDLSLAAHSYDEFFSILKSGIENSEFWSTRNTSKTLQSITGIGSPTDKKRSNVYSLFNDGVGSPAKPTEEDERNDSVILPASARPLISEYDSAQYMYNEAYRQNTIDKEINEYVIRTEKALKDAGLDPAQFRFKYGMKTWPTDTPEPAESRVVSWSFEDDLGHAY